MNTEEKEEKYKIEMEMEKESAISFDSVQVKVENISDINYEMENPDTLSQILTEVRQIKNILSNVENNVCFLNERVTDIQEKQEKLSEMLAENNVLLTRNLGLNLDYWQQKYPLSTKEELKVLNQELCGDKKNQIIHSLKRVLAGSVANIDAIFSKAIILSHNCEGVKGKTSLKEYPALLDAIFEATSNEQSFTNFLMDLRISLRLTKNRINKQESRAKMKEIVKKEYNT